MTDKSNNHSRCSLTSMIKLEKEIHGDIKQEHIDILSRTPFGKLFMAFYNRKFTGRDVTKASDDIIKIVKSYLVDKKAFKLGSTLMKLTVDDFVVTFGLPKAGKIIQLEKRDYTVAQWKSKFVRRRLRGEEKLSKKIIHKSIMETVKLSGKTEEEDFVRLVILFMIVTIFFPNSMGVISWSIIDHIEDFEKMNKVSWAAVFHENLMKNLDRHHKNPIKMLGCVIQVLYWFCEHVDIISPIETYEANTPRATRWSLPELAKALRQTSLGDLAKEKISKRIKGISQEEKDLLKGEPYEVNGKDLVVVKNEEEKPGGEEKEEIKRLRVENEKLKMENKDLKKKLKAIELQNQKDVAEMEELEEKVDEVGSILAKLKRKRRGQKEKPDYEYNVQQKKMKIENREEEDNEKLIDVNDSEFSNFWYFASSNIAKNSVERS